MGKCVICGKPSRYYYTLCRSCYDLQKEGKIVKCEKCNTLHKLESPCNCTPITKYDAPQQVIKTRKNYKNNTNNKYVCKDNHAVDSKSERDIDNYLFLRNIKHTPHKEIYTDEGIPIHPDFYLDDLDVYIEHWGFGKENTKYTQQNEKKKEYYRKSGLTLIYTYEKPDAYDIESALDRKLKFYKKGQVNFDEENDNEGAQTTIASSNANENNDTVTENQAITEQSMPDTKNVQDNLEDEEYYEEERPVPWLKIALAALLVILAYLIFFL